ncbi:MAG: hypothetical protein WA884_05380 [Methyloceanibacter sp.]
MAKKRSAFETLRRVRVGDLQRLFRARYGLEFPDNDAGPIDLKHLLCPISLGPNAEHRMKMAIELWAPWIEESGAPETSSLIAEIMALPRKERMPTAKVLSHRLQVTNVERERIGLRTILPVDMTKEQLAEQRRAKDRARKQRRRLKRGGRTREAYLATFRQRPKPWEIEGMSKRTWYRRKAKAGADKAANGTGSVRTPETVGTGSVRNKSLCMGDEPSATHRLLTPGQRRPSITDSMVPVSTLTLRSDDGLHVFHIEFV